MGVDWCQGFLEPPADHSGITVSDRKTRMIQNGQSVQKLNSFQEK